MQLQKDFETIFSQKSGLMIERWPQFKVKLTELISELEFSAKEAAVVSSNLKHLHTGL